MAWQLAALVQGWFLNLLSDQGFMAFELKRNCLRDRWFVFDTFLAACLSKTRHSISFYHCLPRASSPIIDRPQHCNKHSLTLELPPSAKLKVLYGGKLLSTAGVDDGCGDLGRSLI